MVTGIPPSIKDPGATSAPSATPRETPVRHRPVGRHERDARKLVAWYELQRPRWAPDVLTAARRRDRSDQVLAQRLRGGAR